ncbi:hypothetical protein J2847_000667 [Azospirillum agricola]|uniref:hypothetical protein n=1 Tax=Azospirillum agricola TaxID=1720247 RepID=UPI001AE21982|nr:hypothetical protein [Azospirillum agricola]MBP2227387.1 hypothetical protein [Azospirillum agricola]
MSIDRTELERLLADRPTGNRSAMQAVRESYADIGLMRERGLSWAEISELLARLGVTARDNQPISAVTLRSAFFLVGNEGRGDESAEDASATPPETLAAVHQAALEARRPPAAADGPTEPPTRPPPQPRRSDAAGGLETGAEEARSESADNAPPSDGIPVDEIHTDQIHTDQIPADQIPDSEATAPETGIAAAAPPPAEDPAAAPPEPEPAPTEPPVPEPQAPATPAAPVDAPLPDAPNPGPDHPEPAHWDMGLPEPAAVPPLPAAPPPTASHVTRSPLSHDETTNVFWKGDRMLGTIFVLNDRGGVGKTLLSHHLMATAMLEGLQLKVVEYEVNERLARLFGPEVVEHRRITQDFMNMMGSGDGFYEFWDLIGPELQRGGRLYDFGGNISQWFFNWAEVSGFDYYVGDGERLTFMVPVTVDLASLSTGMATLERVAAIAPKAKRVLVENGSSGPFSQLEDSQYARRKAEMVEREGVHVIAMPPCTAPAWARLTGHRLDQVATMTREDLVKLGMTPPVASRSLIVIHEWLRNMRLALSPYLHDAFRQTGNAPAKAGAR